MKLEKIAYWLVVLLFICLILYFYVCVNYFNYILSSKTIQENPEKYHNTNIQLIGVISDKTNDYFYLKGRDLKFYYKNVKEPKFGEITTLVTFKKQGYFEVIDIHYHNYSFVKYILSSLAAFLFIFIFLKEWKITLRGFKKNA